jgi:hypothetical protein
MLPDADGSLSIDSPSKLTSISLSELSEPYEPYAARAQKPITDSAVTLQQLEIHYRVGLDTVNIFDAESTTH